jgi:hypothetical protein
MPKSSQARLDMSYLSAFERVLSTETIKNRGAYISRNRKLEANNTAKEK